MVRYAVERVTPASVFPVLVDQLAEFMGGVDAADPLLPGVIATATDLCERHTQMAFLVDEFREVQDAPPGGATAWWDGVRELPVTEAVPIPSTLNLHRYPVVSVTSVEFFDDADVSTEAAAASYYVDRVRRDPRIVLRSGYSWPSVVLRVANAIEVHYQAGFGAEGDVPEAIKLAIKTAAAYIYEHRGACDMGDVISKSGAAALLSPYKPTRI
nr:hypothetical protein [uncultured Roseateles sp.]